jgi:hypothetical protein
VHDFEKVRVRATSALAGIVPHYPKSMRAIVFALCAVVQVNERMRVYASPTHFVLVCISIDVHVHVVF